MARSVFYLLPVVNAQPNWVWTLCDKSTVLARSVIIYLINIIASPSF